MSAPVAVNTADGACWTLRTVTAGGIGLYAPEAVKTCPEFVMATLEDLAAHGIQDSAYALPMPVGPAAQAAAPFVPRTERSYWVDIAAALNAAESVGMSIGIDLDGTLTDRNTWSVIWDRTTKRWAVAGYDEDDTGAPTSQSEMVRAGHFSEAARLLEDTGRDDDAVNLLDNVADGIRTHAAADAPHEGPQHHTYRLGRDLPETGGAPC